MVGIKSTKEMIYDTRSDKSGFIEIEVSKWCYEPQTETYSVTVEDYLLSEIITSQGWNSETNEPETIEYQERKVISTKTIPYSKQKINYIFNVIGNTIFAQEDFTFELNHIIALALLFETQSQPVYYVKETGLVAKSEDWVLSNNS